MAVRTVSCERTTKGERIDRAGLLWSFRVRLTGINDAEWFEKKSGRRASRKEFRETPDGAAVSVRGLGRGDRPALGDAALGANFGSGAGRVLRGCAQPIRGRYGCEVTD